MTDTFTAALIHDGTIPDIPTQFTLTDTINQTDFLTRVMGGGHPDDILTELPEIVLCAVSLSESGDSGLGVEGAFATLNRPVVNITDTPDSKAMYRRFTKATTVYTSRFDATISPSELQEPGGISRICSLARDYRTLREKAPLQYSDVLELLNAPERVDIANKAPVIPSEVFADGGCENVRVLADWIIDKFLSTPGLIIGTERAAIQADMRVPVFHECAGIFSDARYTGIFSEYVGEKWWRIEVLLSMQSVSVSECDRPQCLKCGETGVDRAALFVEDGLTTVQPVHYRCSNIARTLGDDYLDERNVSLDSESDSTMYNNF